jgi:hypothetical protein
MRRMLLILMVLANAGLAEDNWAWKKRLSDAINATSEAREILLKDLQDADLGPTVRSEFEGCPSREQFAKILEDEERYNAAARRWLKEAPAQ